IPSRVTRFRSPPVLVVDSEDVKPGPPPPGAPQLKNACPTCVFAKEPERRDSGSGAALRRGCPTTAVRVGESRCRRVPKNGPCCAQPFLARHKYRTASTSSVRPAP